MVEFALQIEPQYGFPYRRIRDLALLCEELGFGSIWCSDHLFLDDHSAERDCWEAWTALTGLAVETSTVRIGTLVTCNSYRHPSLLAKIAACVDVMSDGRLEFGIGAGWKEPEYLAYGYGFPPIKERVDRLAEAVPLIRSLWTEPQASFQGRYYQIDGAFSSPKPVQEPHPPIMVGGGGDRVLGIAARYADAVNIGGGRSPEAYAERLASLERSCEHYGRDLRAIRQSVFIPCITGTDASEVERGLAAVAAAFGRTPEETRERMGRFAGTPDELLPVYRRYVELGVQQFMLLFPYGAEERGMELAATHLLPQLG